MIHHSYFFLFFNYDKNVKFTTIRHPNEKEKKNCSSKFIKKHSRIIIKIKIIQMIFFIKYIIFAL